MRKNKNLAAAIMALNILFSLCACANVDGETSTVSGDNTLEQITNSTNNSTNISSTDGGYQETISNENFSTKCKIYKQRAKLFTEEQLLKMFDETPKKEDKSFEDYSYFEFTTEKCTGRIINNRIISFAIDAQSVYNGIYQALSRNTSNEEYISKDDSLDFEPREKVLDELRKQLLDTFGIDPDEWWVQEFYAVKKEGVDFYKMKIAEEAAADAANSEENDDEKLQQTLKQLDDISSEDFYVINIKFQLDGIPLYTGDTFDYGVDGMYSIMGPWASVIYSKDGIVTLDLAYLNETDTSAAEEVTLIETEKARGLIQKKFSDIILDTPVEVYDMQLVYLPIPQNDLNSQFESFEAKPFYAFYWKETGTYNGETFESDYITYFDAVTGAEFGTEGNYISEW